MQGAESSVLSFWCWEVRVAFFVLLLLLFCYLLACSVVQVCKGWVGTMYTIIREGGVGGEVEASLCYCVIVIVIVILLLCKGWDLVYYYEGWREVGGEGEASSSVFLQLASGTFQPNFLHWMPELVF